MNNIRLKDVAIKMMKKWYVGENGIGSCKKKEDDSFFFSYLETQLIDKKGKLLIYPFELIKIEDTCHHQIIFHTSYKSMTLYRILYLYIYIYIYIYIYM